MRIGLFSVVFVSALHGQPPAIFQNGVTQSASRLAGAIPGGVAAPGSRIHIAGIRFTSSQKEAFALRIEVAGKTFELAPTRVSAGEAEALLPLHLPTGAAMLRVGRGGQWSNGVAFRLSPYAVGLYSRNGRGWGPGDFGSRRSARPGEEVLLRAEGLVPGKRVPLRVANREVDAEATAQGFLRFRLPKETPLGCFVPIQAASNVVSIELRGGTQPCEMEDGWPRPATANGIMTVEKFDLILELHPGEPGRGIEEAAHAAFFRLPPDGFATPHLLPPRGTCLAGGHRYEAGDLLGSLLGLTGRDASSALDAGKQLLTITPAAQRPLLLNAQGIYRAFFTRKAEGILNASPVRIEGPGGKDIGPLKASIRVAAPLSWTNRDNIETVTRSAGATVEWTNADLARAVIVAGVGADRLTTAAWTFVCAAEPKPGRFSIAPSFLANLPPTASAGGLPMGLLAVYQVHAESFSARGLPKGTLAFAGGSARSVVWR